MEVKVEKNNGHCRGCTDRNLLYVFVREMESIGDWNFHLTPYWLTRQLVPFSRVFDIGILDFVVAME